MQDLYESGNLEAVFYSEIIQVLEGLDEKLPFYLPAIKPYCVKKKNVKDGKLSFGTLHSLMFMGLLNSKLFLNT